MKLFIIPSDKANHFLYGLLAGFLAQLFCLSSAFPSVAPLAAFSVAGTLGVLKEAGDAWDNRVARKANLPLPHSVDTLDAVATAAGGLFLGFAIYLQGAFA